MAFLLLYMGEGQKFDGHEIETSLQALEGANSLKTSQSRSLAYEYHRRDDFTTIQLDHNQETIMFDGSGEASLSAALHIQSNYPKDIRLIDEGYGFDIVLRGIT
jgi:hypothetical protein